MVHMELTVRLPVIGVVRTSHQELETTPIQAGLNRAGHGTIEIAEPYRDGLDGLAEFDYQAVRFAGVDLLDGTPVIDLKPYVTRFDQPPGNPRCGWFDQLTIPDGTTPEQLAPPPAGP